MQMREAPVAQQKIILRIMGGRQRVPQIKFEGFSLARKRSLAFLIFHTFFCNSLPRAKKCPGEKNNKCLKFCQSLCVVPLISNIIFC